MRWARHAAFMGELRNAYKILVRKPDGKKPPRRPRRRQDDIIKIDFTEIMRQWTGFSWLKTGYLGHHKRRGISLIS
jgi:hypothetical protein